MMLRRPVSIRTVAEVAGVSTATVSNVLSGKTSVTPGLVERVHAAVAQLGYVADGSASRLRSGKQALAGVVVPDLGNPFFGAFVSTLEHLARNDGFDLLVVSSYNQATQEAARLDKIRSWRPAGLIVIPCDGELTRRLPANILAPIVAVDRIPEDGAFDLIAVNNRDAAAAIAAHGAEQGFQTCLVAGSSLRISNIRERWEGAQSGKGRMDLTLIETGIKLEPKEAAHVVRERLTSSALPEFLICLEHATMLAAYQVLLDLGIRVGIDMAVACFDETEWMRLVRPGLTTARQPVEAMAEAAWSRLKQRMGGDDSPPIRLRLACTIEIRGSTRRKVGSSHNAATSINK